MPRGFDIVGALLVGTEGSVADSSSRALKLARLLRERLFSEAASHAMVGGCMDAATGEIRFVASESSVSNAVEGSEVVWEDEPGRLLWEKGCLLRCELQLKLPLYVPADKMSGKCTAKQGSMSFSSVVNPVTSVTSENCSVCLEKGPNCFTNRDSCIHLPHWQKCCDSASNSV